MASTRNGRAGGSTPVGASLATPACVFAALALILAAAGCQSSRARPAKRAASAKHAFNLVVRQAHVPAGDSTNDIERAELLVRAAAGYQDIVKRYPDQPQWAAQSLRSLGNVYQLQGRPADALSAYDRVGRDYPGEHWEVIQAWKSAGDLLLDTGDREGAARYFRRIVDTYDRADAAPMFRTLVDISRRRLGDDAR